MYMEAAGCLLITNTIQTIDSKQLLSSQMKCYLIRIKVTFVCCRKIEERLLLAVDLIQQYLLPAELQGDKVGVTLTTNTTLFLCV